VIDVDRRTVDVELSEEELARRRAAWTPPPPKYPHGLFAKYARLVSSAAQGAVCIPS
jgi:dihydroxy-acid dehydratase